MFLSPGSNGVNATGDHAVIGARYFHESRMVRVYGLDRGLELGARNPSQSRANWSVLVLCERALLTFVAIFRVCYDPAPIRPRLHMLRI
jgi:hypothetical protein